ncbi:MAG: tRNA guanosine(34) transglycosylase Tgt [Bacteroidota bacterium]|nr:tRNA guanosine(34) transglycosylase Tgt [Candidatus Kapabacteria bacterium]MCS7302023.1 tRNA guanosine(34) transglycosylase Tgt [Candidatus Kapabacteria bacterium]MDW8074542.1 tRNA guanosine(34) transglycosylase Tgt [Bacteroidota bacterium]MDW8270982.1 tRNA guanosine(34) transglycosylase Tgt [Bacteroidota bacterium]
MFTVIAHDPHSKARAGILYTDHGAVETPVFMPVATQGAIKALDHRMAEKLHYKMLLANTYHLYLRPGTEVLRRFGGLHRFMQWSGALLTDSGGFQVYSLDKLRRVFDGGVEFRSHIDGSRHVFTPWAVIEYQRAIGADVIMVLDECIGYPMTYQQAKEAMVRSVEWAKESLSAHKQIPFYYSYRQQLFGIVQGGTFFDLRQACTEQLCQLPFDGFAIGGLAVGEPIPLMYDVVDFSTDLLPPDKPRYLMGVGSPQNILQAIARGVDMFDCVMPTRNARNGTVFTTQGRINIRNQRFKYEEAPVEPRWEELGVEPISLGYLRHLFVAGEILGLTLATMQNLAFYRWLVRSAREKILAGTFRQWSGEFLEQFYPDTKVESSF